MRAETLLGPWHRDFLSTSLLVGEGSEDLSREGLTAQLGSLWQRSKSGDSYPRESWVSPSLPGGAVGCLGRAPEACLGEHRPWDQPVLDFASLLTYLP